nr:testis-specific Y-encoded protein 9 isoform X1 [Oryctolagus cuniculus]
MSAEEKQEKNGPAWPGHVSLACQPLLEELEALQLDMQPVNNQATRAYARLKQKLQQRRRVLLEQRRSVIQDIPGFWAKVFVNHPQMSAMVRDKDEDLLSYMVNLQFAFTLSWQVEEVNHPNNCCKIKMYFQINPYFCNKLIEKEYLRDVKGYIAYHSTTVKWHRTYKHEAQSRRQYSSTLSIFNWFLDHNFVGSNRIAEIICKDMWLNPVAYYPREETSGQETEDASEQPSCSVEGCPEI